jgi:signal peptidase I
VLDATKHTTLEKSSYNNLKVQKITRVDGDYAKKGEDIKDGDTITIANGGTIVTGDYGDRPVFKVETRNGEKNLSFNQKSMNNLIDVYGDETGNWIGKKAKVWLVRALVSGKFQQVVYLAGPTWTMLDDGAFVQAPNQRTPEIPVVDEDSDVKVEDVPF